MPDDLTRQTNRTPSREPVTLSPNRYAANPTPSNAEPVTLSPKCYIQCCAGCGLLFEATRRDQITCSGACRVRAYRSGEIKRLKVIAAQVGEIDVSDILRARAVKMLCPELEPRLRSGSLTFDQARPEMHRAFIERLMEAALAMEGEQ